MFLNSQLSQIHNQTIQKILKLKYDNSVEMEGHKKQLSNLDDIHKMMKQYFISNLTENVNLIDGNIHDESNHIPYYDILVDVGNLEIQDNDCNTLDSDYLQVLFSKYNSLKVKILNNKYSCKINNLSNINDFSNINTSDFNNKIIMKNEDSNQIKSCDLLAKTRLGLKKVKKTAKII
jgi:hypothetical protein